jgi:NAD(P)-dependent dehydrogenase (short-subunit alcohol dehydrogenase family)
MRGLRGKVAIVTGATKAMGETVAERLASEGCLLITCGRDEKPGEACAQRIRDSDGRARFLRTDVSREDEIRHLVATAVETYGRLDIVVNVAAAIDIIRAGEVKPVVEESTENWHYQMVVNAYAPFWLFKYAIPPMIEAGGGAFVNLSTMASTKVGLGMPSYVASKSAMEALTRQVAVDYGKYNIRANCIMTGAIMVPQNRHLHEHPVAGPAMREMRILCRSGTPDDIACMCAFLASEESGWTTGALIPVEGGASIKASTPNIGGVYAEMSKGQAGKG